MPLVTRFDRSAASVSSMRFRKKLMNGLNPIWLAVCAHQNGPEQSSIRSTTRLGNPRITNGLRAAHTTPRHTKSSKPSSGPRTAVGIQA